MSKAVLINVDFSYADLELLEYALTEVINVWGKDACKYRKKEGTVYAAAARECAFNANVAREIADKISERRAVLRKKIFG